MVDGIIHRLKILDIFADDILREIKLLSCVTMTGITRKVIL